MGSDVSSRAVTATLSSEVGSNHLTLPICPHAPLSFHFLATVTL